MLLTRFEIFAVVHLSHVLNRLKVSAVEAFRAVNAYGYSSFGRPQSCRVGD